MIPVRIHSDVRRITVVGAIAAAAAPAVACGDGSTAPGSPVGSYALSSVNGKPLPANVFSDTGFTVDISDGVLAVDGDGRFVMAVTSKWTVDGNLTVFASADTGRWTQAGDTIVLTFSDSATETGTWKGNFITLADSTGVSARTFLFARK